MKYLSFAAVLIFSATAVLADSVPAMSTGTVTKVDTQWNKVTIDHGPLENLDMPAMKMVFTVADPELLEGVSEGAQVSFLADRVNGKLTVTQMSKQ